MRTYDPQYEICPHCGYAVGTEAERKNHLPPGTTLANGRFTLGRVLGQGGFGITYIAWDGKVNKAVAIKEYMPGVLASRAFGEKEVTCYSETAQRYFNAGLEKTRQEAKILGTLSELESVVQVFDIIEENGTAYIVMELLRGSNIRDLLAQQGAMPPEKALSVIEPVLRTLQAMHGAGIIHRDVAPDNIYLCENGKVKLLDFGAARVVREEDESSISVTLKKGYAPPEQYLTHGRLGAYTDVYAAAATLYKMLTGETPAEGLEREKSGGALTFAKDVPQAIRGAICRAMEPDAAKRTQTAAQFLRELTGGQTGGRTGERTGGRGIPWKKIVIPAAAVLAAAVIAIGVWKAVRSGKPHIEPEQTITSVQAAQTLLPADIQVGDTITFGTYEQNGDTSDGAEPIDWIVLDRQADRALVLSRYCLDQMPYHSQEENVTWETSSLRQWLNGAFLQDAFSAEERQLICRTTLENEDNPQYGTDGGEDTQDDVFVLSVSEAQKYFDTDKSRMGTATQYAKQRGAFAGASNGTSWWWLRTPGETGTKAVLVYIDGKIVMRGGDRVNIGNDTVRPALWLRTGAPSETTGAQKTEAATEKHKPQTREELREELKRNTSLEIVSFDCLDYNHDGSQEVFAIVASGFKQAEYNGYEADRLEIWFVSSDDCVKADTWDENVWFTEGETYKLSDECFGWAIGSIGAHVAYSNYAVTASGTYKALPETQDSLPDLSYAFPKETVMLNLGMGYHSMPQYFYFDAKRCGFVEYGGIEISEAQLKKLSGTQKAFDQIRQEKGTIQNILYRKNGAVNINYTVGEGDTRFITMAIGQDGSVSYDTRLGWSSTDELYTNGGYYVASVVEEFGEYDDGFLGVDYPDSFPY